MTQQIEHPINSILKEMSDVSRRSKAFVELIATDDTLSQNHIMLLIQLRISESMKITEIASIFHISAGAATSMCDRLESMEIIKRVREKEDRRVVRVVLTEKGEQKIADIFKKVPSEKLVQIEKVFKEVNKLMAQII